jgi:hypothetical protein
MIVTTHSPYIVAETPFTRLGIVKMQGQHSTLHVAEVRDAREREIFDAYSNEVNSLLFFADKVVLVEGESDARVIRLLLEKKLDVYAHRVSFISAAGNTNFSPFLRMIRAWRTAKIPHLVVTDFDSLMKETGRAVLTGAKEAGYAITGETAFHAKVDAVLDKGEAEFTEVATEATTLFSSAGLNVFVFTSDLENSLITAANKDAAAKVLTGEATNGVNYGTGYDLNALKRCIGSKGIPLNSRDDPPFKKPFIHRKIADTVTLTNPHPDIARLLAAIEAL